MEPWVWSVVLLLVGLFVVAIEMFIPSGGALAVMAALCFLGGIAVAFLDSLRTGLVMLGITTLIVPVVIGLAIQWWPRTPIGRRILIPPPENPDEVLPETEEHRALKSVVGRQGMTASMMMPGGIVTVDHHSFDAVSLGMPIEENVPVEIVAVRMNRLVVRPCESLHGGEQPDSAPSGSAREDMLSRPIDSLGIEDPLA